jgi:hypothetical protein
MRSCVVFVGALVSLQLNWAGFDSGMRRRRGDVESVNSGDPYSFAPPRPMANNYSTAIHF